jgi:hypothetical protein
VWYYYHHRKKERLAREHFSFGSVSEADGNNHGAIQPIPTMPLLFLDFRRVVRVD